MTHYYSDVLDWWNKAFSRLERSGEFHELCEQSQEKHGMSKPSYFILYGKTIIDAHCLTNI